MILGAHTDPLTDALNSATKYPSIDTLHKLGDKGRPTDEVQVVFDTGPVGVTEKIDGTNVRLIFPADRDFMTVGSREELLWVEGDTLHSSSLSIASHMRWLSDNLFDYNALSMLREDYGTTNDVFVIYGELYGGRIGSNAKQYTTDTTQVGFRIFDAAVIPDEILDLKPAEIARWRDGGGQSFVDETTLQVISDRLRLPLAPRTTMLHALTDTSLDGVRLLMERLQATSAVILDDRAPGKVEGFVLRDEHRTRIAKIRYQDYAKLGPRSELLR